MCTFHVPYAQIWLTGSQIFALHAFTQSFTSLLYFCLESLKTANAVPLQYEFDSSNYHDCLWRPLQEEREALSFTKNVCLIKTYIHDPFYKFESKDWNIVLCTVSTTISSKAVQKSWVHPHAVIYIYIFRKMVNRCQFTKTSANTEI